MSEVSVILLTHGATGAEMLRTLEKMLGRPVSGFEAVEVTHGEDKKGVADRLAAAVDRIDQGRGVLVVTDLFGSTPCNCAVEIAKRHEHLVEVMCGLNLPMLVKLASVSREVTPAELVRGALETAHRSIRMVTGSEGGA